MASTVRVSVDMRDLVRDLQAIGDGLDQPIREALGAGAEEITSDAKAFMRYRPGGAWKGSSGARFDHIRDYYSARMADLSAVVESAHPAAPVWEWGGTIHPLLGKGLHHFLSTSRAKGVAQFALSAAGQDRAPWTYVIPRTQPVGTAAVAREDGIAQNLEDAVGRLIHQYGF